MLTDSQMRARIAQHYAAMIIALTLSGCALWALWKYGLTGIILAAMLAGLAALLKD